MAEVSLQEFRARNVFAGKVERARVAVERAHVRRILAQNTCAEARARARIEHVLAADHRRERLVQWQRAGRDAAQSGVSTLAAAQHGHAFAGGESGYDLGLASAEFVAGIAGVLAFRGLSGSAGRGHRAPCAAWASWMALGTAMVHASRSGVSTRVISSMALVSALRLAVCSRSIQKPYRASSWPHSSGATSWSRAMVSSDRIACDLDRSSRARACCLFSKQSLAPFKKRNRPSYRASSNSPGVEVALRIWV